MSREEEIVAALVATGKWGPTAARRGVRANFRCEYCDRDLLASVNDYKEWQEDHIVPVSSGGKDEDENVAIACRTCNFNVKGKWDPRSVCGGNATRQELVDAVRRYVAQRRTKFLEDVLLFRKIAYSVTDNGEGRDAGKDGT